MNTLKELIIKICNIHSLRHSLCLFFVCVMGIAFISSSFISCTPGFDDRASTNDGNNDDEDDRRDDDNDEDDDEGEKCRGSETCERICEHIYEEYSEARECMDMGDIKVGKLDKIHDLLMTDFSDVNDLKRNLDNISEGEDDVDINDLEDYLKIGGTKWRNAIERELGISGNGGLIEVLDWFIRDKEVAEILSEVNDGDNILEALLVTLSSKTQHNPGHCMTTGNVAAPRDGAQPIGLWKLDNSIADEPKLQIGYFYNSGVVGEIRLKNDIHAKLYDALSCLYSDIGAGDNNIFSEAVNDENETIFNMAFNLLNKVCSDLHKNPTFDEDVACRKALFCWTADKLGETNQPNGQFLGSDFVEGKESQLESDESNYNQCQAKHFAEFFSNTN